MNLFGEHPKYKMLIIFAIAFIATWAIFWPLLKIARKSNLYDNPGERKLQAAPIPVLGGAAVFFGIMVGIGFFKTMHSFSALFPVICAMMIMLYIGIIDDLNGTKAWTRLLLEILVAALVIFGNRYCITNFQGLWGIDILPYAPAVLISIISFVGIVNSINMIDGIDGLMSGFCLLIFGCFGMLFFRVEDFSYAALCAAAIGAILPFFLHNVFGYKTKMFVGDGGTMVMGTLISAMVFELLRGRFHQALYLKTGVDFSLIAYCLAVLSIPISDTLRVMTERICHHQSPFTPGKNHLHHLFIEVGFSYIFTSIIELTLNLMVVAILFVVYHIGASVNLQVYIVLISATLFNVGTACALRRIAASDSRFAQWVKRMAIKSHVERIGIWYKIQKIIDRE